MVPALPPRVHREARAFEALGSHPRLEILERLATRPMSIADLVREMGLPRVTVRYHMSVLVREGLAEEVEVRGTRKVGRPPRMYVAKKTVAVNGYPRRHYELIGNVALDTLLQEVGEERAVKALRARGAAMGKSVMDSVAAEHRVTRWDPETFERLVLQGVFREQGGPIEVVSLAERELTYRAFNCPFLELAQKRPKLVCDALDVGFHEGIGRALGGVETERIACIGHGSPHCEYRMKWRPTRDRKSARS